MYPVVVEWSLNASNVRVFGTLGGNVVRSHNVIDNNSSRLNKGSVCLTVSLIFAIVNLTDLYIKNRLARCYPLALHLEAMAHQARWQDARPRLRLNIFVPPAVVPGLDDNRDPNVRKQVAVHVVRLGCSVVQLNGLMN